MTRSKTKRQQALTGEVLAKVPLDPSTNLFTLSTPMNYMDPTESQDESDHSLVSNSTYNLSPEQINFLIRNVVYPSNSIVSKEVSTLDRHYTLYVALWLASFLVMAIIVVVPPAVVTDWSDLVPYFAIVPLCVLFHLVGFGIFVYWLRNKTKKCHSHCEEGIRNILSVEERRINEGIKHGSDGEESEFVNSLVKHGVTSGTVKLDVDYPSNKFSLKNKWKFLSDSPVIMVHLTATNDEEISNDIAVDDLAEADDRSGMV